MVLPLERRPWPLPGKTGGLVGTQLAVACSRNECCALERSKAVSVCEVRTAPVGVAGWMGGLKEKPMARLPLACWPCVTGSHHAIMTCGTVTQADDQKGRRRRRRTSRRREGLR